MSHHNGGVENTGFTDSRDDPDGELHQINGKTNVPSNGSAVTHTDDFVNDSDDDINKDAEKAREANKNGVTPEMMQRFQNLPPEMRQVFMNMSDKDRQKFVEMRKKAANWPEEKRKKMFQKMYKDYMQSQVRNIMRARRYTLSSFSRSCFEIGILNKHNGTSFKIGYFHMGVGAVFFFFFNSVQVEVWRKSSMDDLGNFPLQNLTNFPELLQPCIFRFDSKWMYQEQ